MDTSAWAGEVPAEVFACLRAVHRVGEFIPQLWGGGPQGTGPNPYLGQQVLAAREAGLVVRRVYVWPPSAVDRALDVWLETFGGWDGLKVVALDVEYGPRARAHPAHVEAVRSRGLIPEIYTSVGEWEKVMGDSPHYAWFALNAVPLWAAWYPRREWDGYWPESFPEGDTWVPRPWRGRPELISGWQLAGTTDLCGKPFDLNIMG